MVRFGANLLGMVLDVLKRGWGDAFKFFGGWPALLTLVPMPLVGLGLHSLFGSPQDVSAEWVIWLTYGLAAAGVVFIAVLLWNVACAPFRIMRDRAEDAESRLAAAGGAPGDAGPLLPNWSITDLFFNLRPDVLESQGGDAGEWEVNVWESVEQMFRDAAALGQLKVWGRRFDTSGMAQVLNEVNPPKAIDPSYWHDASLTHDFYTDHNPLLRPHTYPKAGSNQITYCDLRVNQEQALAIWPEPDPETKIYVDVDVSASGVVAVHPNAMVGIRKAQWDDEKTNPDLKLFFYRPIVREYFVEVSGDDHISKRVIEKTPEHVLLEIRSHSFGTFPARVKIVISARGRRSKATTVKGKRTDARQA